MSHSAKVLAHSVSPAGVELASLEVCMPRIILAEFNTHRMFSRNSASSRAIPVEKMVRMVQEQPYVPESWGKNQKGMQAGEELTGTAAEDSRHQWLSARDAAVARALNLLSIGVHKQLTNRLLEPFMWHTVIVSSTEWDNFFHLRDHKDAHPDIQKVARLMRKALAASKPRKLLYAGDPKAAGWPRCCWHLPLIGDEDDLLAEPLLKQDPMALVKVSVGRCARVSYLTHDGKRDLQADIELHDRLLTSGHLSPFEHAARPANKDDSDLQYGPHAAQHPLIGTTDLWFGNFRGWVQYRKTIPNEADSLGGSS